ncbi:SET domain-containing protein-lysine N-methyltransferase [Cerasicoccus fimbriatus]|uniref:SET domain-containing protein-lysine N-methyltransferase n=1 Tax=Cerasicoccus fimbriatus TaxID=3014554 RepID=UPI0022B43CC2|nr:SET domain-containing protein [Cerasicoccus sp. TK19100]
MIIPPYRIDTATIVEAGKGLFLEGPVKAGTVIVSPDKIDRVYTRAELDGFGPGSPEDDASVRWFEGYYTVSLDWPDECYINHSFSPNGLWHLGFVFALRDIAPGEELTMDYRLIVGDGERLPFNDAATGEPIIGLPWRENLRTTTTALAKLL